MSVAVRLPEHVAGARQRFVQSIRTILPNTSGGVTTPRVFYMPRYGEAAVVTDDIGRVWTHANTPVGRISRLGNGAALSFNGTSDFLSTPDAVNLSFGNGAADTPPFSMFAVCNVTDTAGIRTIIGKFDTGLSEYSFDIGATDLFRLLTSDQSVPVNTTRITDAAIVQGSWASIGASYDGSGGASAGNGMTIYQNGAVVASTATNNASYVAMENLTALATIGANVFSAPASFFAGSIALVLLVGANLTASQFFQLNQASRRFFGI